MPAFILIRGTDNGTDPMNFRKGFPVSVSTTPQLYAGSDQVPPDFIEVEITDATVDQVRAYCDEWYRFLDYEFIGHDYSLDGHRLRFFCRPELVSVSGINGLTRAQVETWLNRWRCDIVSASTNDVVFDAVVYNVICSAGFWDMENVLATVAFTEKSYDQATGIHQVEANYRNAPQLVAAGPEVIAAAVEAKGGTVSSAPTNKIIFNIGRDAVFAVFKQAVKDALDGPAYRRKVYLAEAAVDQALSSGGSLSMTRAQATGFIKNRLDE